MEYLAYGFVPLALATVAAVLELGLWNMARGRDPDRSQRLMRWRVILQFLAVCAVMAAIWFAQKG